MIYKNINKLCSGNIILHIEDHYSGDRFAYSDEHTFITVVKHVPLHSLCIDTTSIILDVDGATAWLYVND